MTESLQESAKCHSAGRAPILATILLALAPLLPAQEAPPIPLSEVPRADWARDATWADGRAELAIYSGQGVVGVAPAPQTLQTLTVPEDFNREYNVKADWPHGEKPIQPVMKQLQFVGSGDTAHQATTSVYVDRDNPVRLLKMTISTFNWTGITTKEFNFAPRVPSWTWSSYWDGEGSGRESLRGWPRAGVFEEQLPVLVRVLDLRDGLQVALALAPDQTTNRALRPEPVAARLRVQRPDGEMRIPAGIWARENALRVTIEAADGRSHELIVAEEMPRVLLAWSANDGRVFTLQSVTHGALSQILSSEIQSSGGVGH